MEGYILQWMDKALTNTKTMTAVSPTGFIIVLRINKLMTALSVTGFMVAQNAIEVMITHERVCGCTFYSRVCDSGINNRVYICTIY